MKKYPKIGIRPTIDGRQGGVRESLEEKTMNLAKAVAELITSNLKNGDGSPVECVISDSTIGRVAESAACAEKFEREGVGSTITVTSCWCYGAETMDMNPYYPKAVWGFNGTERPGAVYLAAVLAGHAQKGLPAFGIYCTNVHNSCRYNLDVQIPFPTPKEMRRKSCTYVIVRCNGDCRQEKRRPISAWKLGIYHTLQIGRAMRIYARLKIQLLV